MDRRVRGASRRDDQNGFTIIEMMIALMLIALVMTALLSAIYGGQRALAAAHQRTMMLEVGNSELENLRALPYASVAVESDDPMLSTSYPGGQYQSKDAVVVSPGAVTPAPLPAVSVVTLSQLQGIVLPYTVQRYVTWTDPAGVHHPRIQAADGRDLLDGQRGNVCERSPTPHCCTRADWV